MIEYRPIEYTLMGIFLLAIILFVLVLSILFGNSLDKLMGYGVEAEEGFISYNVSGAIGSDITYANYSSTNPITKLYDNIYFDKSNAHLIEFNGPEAIPGVNANELVGVSGEQITNIRVYPRSNTPSDYTVSPSLEVIKSAGTVASSNAQFVAESTSGSTKYSTIYVAFDTTTYIHIINTTELKDLETFKLTGSSVENKTHNTSIAVSDLRNNTKLITSSDDGSYIESTRVIFSRPVQKLGSMFYYDVSSGAAIQVFLQGVNYEDSYAEVSMRPTEKTSDFPLKKVTDRVEPTELGKVESTGFATKLYQDSYIRVVQIVDGAKTVFILYYLSNGSIKIHSVYRYNSTVSVDTIKTVGDKMPNTMSLNELTELFIKIMDEYNKRVGNNKKGSGSGIDNISESEEYVKWLAYWNTEAGKMTNNSNDYILKTMIVPPVCPTCPNCPSCGSDQAANGKCVNCGVKTDASGVAGTGAGSGVAGIQATDSELTRLAASTGRGVKEIATGATTGAVGLAKETVGGTVGLAKETVGGAVGLARETVGGAVGLVREAGGEVKGLFGKLSPTQVRNIQMGDGGVSPQAGGFAYGESGEYGIPSRGSRYAGSDPYSYNGSLVSKGGNFIPITADFSRFGR